MCQVADQFISVFIGMYLEKIHHWSTNDPASTGGFVVCLPWESTLTSVVTQIGTRPKFETYSDYPRITRRPVQV